MSKKQLQRAAKRKFIGTREYVDSVTGEVVSTTNVFRNDNKKSIFVIMYIDDSNVYDLMSGLGNPGKVLGFILKEFNERSCLFYFSTTNKDRMVSELGLSIGTVRAIVKSFSDSAIICRVRGAEYMVNPHLFYKGHSMKRDESCREFDMHNAIQNMKETQKSIDEKTVKS